MLVRIVKRKTVNRLLLQGQSDLGLHCLSMPFLQATSVQNFQTSTVVLKQQEEESSVLIKRTEI